MPLPPVPPELAEAATRHPKPHSSPYMGTIVPEGFSAPMSPTSPTTSDAKAAAKKAARARFEGVYDKMRDGVLERFKAMGMPDDAVQWYKRNLDWNVRGGKLNRGMSVVDSVAIIKGRELTEDEYFKAGLLGWGVELLQAYFLVADDMMDQSFTRRGQPCWYRVEGVGAIAINDAFMLEGAIYDVLKAHFREEPIYADLLEFFHAATYQTETGQLIDLITAPENHVDLSRFSLKKHQLIVIYKTSYYSFYLPVALAMLFCHIPSPSLIWKPSPASASGAAALPEDPYKLAESILVPLGEYFQVQDDFLDYAGTPEQLGKVGTDIVDNKCSWCINTALELADAAQRAVLESNYGRKDARAEERVKAVYEELGLRARYDEYERAAHARIVALVQRLPDVPAGREGLRREVFMTFLEKIYGRTK